MPGDVFCVVFEAQDDLAMHDLLVSATTGDLVKAQYLLLEHAGVLKNVS
jgi:hypothetical protein